MVLRMTTAFVFSVALVFYVPSWWLKPVSRIAVVMVSAGCPFLEDMNVKVKESSIYAEGVIHVDMIMSGGEPLPLTRGNWQKYAGQTLNILIVAAAAWAAPAVGCRRRLVALPVMLLVAASASGFDLALEIQESALRVIGYEWVPSFSLAQTPGNLETFRRLENWYQGVLHIKAYNDGGGRLFSGLLAGLIGYALPAGIAAGHRRGFPVE